MGRDPTKAFCNPQAIQTTKHDIGYYATHCPNLFKPSCCLHHCVADLGNPLRTIYYLRVSLGRLAGKTPTITFRSSWSFVWSLAVDWLLRFWCMHDLPSTTDALPLLYVMDALSSLPLYWWMLCHPLVIWADALPDCIVWWMLCHHYHTELDVLSLSGPVA